jgi:hypothetical protein
VAEEGRFCPLVEGNRGKIDDAFRLLVDGDRCPRGDAFRSLLDENRCPRGGASGRNSVGWHGFGVRRVWLRCGTAAIGLVGGNWVV